MLSLLQVYPHSTEQSRAQPSPDSKLPSSQTIAEAASFPEISPSPQTGEHESA
jgi:hypothetical protein